MNLPNTLTATRIFLVPLLVVVLLTGFEGRRILTLPVELVAARSPTGSTATWRGGVSR
jgi:phosphatidylglycerophosphate synthase